MELQPPEYLNTLYNLKCFTFGDYTILRVHISIFHRGIYYCALKNLVSIYLTLLINQWTDVYHLFHKKTVKLHVFLLYGMLSI